MVGEAWEEPVYADLIDALAAFRSEQLGHLPSDRALAEAARVSPTTVGHWLRGDRFPQEIDPLLRLVRAVQAQAERVQCADSPVAAAVFDQHRWRRAFRDEAGRRAAATSDAMQAGQGRTILEQMRPGRPLTAVSDPFHLEVHHPIRSAVAGLPVLPSYVPREHDQTLAAMVDDAAAGESRIAVLVGESSTGKTRACWEALNLLRARGEQWRVWHPIDSIRPEAALAELVHLSPHTVVWLNEAQLYLDASLGEQVAAGLRTMLNDPRHAPLLVLATLWPDHWHTLTTRTAPDPHAQARQLLLGHRISVPTAFTAADLNALADARVNDPRLAEAADHARDGQITQYLAGGPILLHRYHDAGPATRSLIHAAMDARRLGAGPRIPAAWLVQAAAGYFTENEWEERSEGWLEQALVYVTDRRGGIPAILTPIPSNSGAARNQRKTRHTDTASGSRFPTGQGACYRLSDYLDQEGRRTRAAIIPPIDFWVAAADHAPAADLDVLGDAAWDRGLYRDAAQLHKRATTNGSAHAAATLVGHLRTVHGTVSGLARHAAVHAGLDDASAVAFLLRVLREVGAQEQVAIMLDRNPAAHIAADRPHAVVRLLEVLRALGAEDQVALLAERAAVQTLLDALRQAGAQEQMVVLAERAGRVAADDPQIGAWLLEVLREAGALEQVAALAERTASQAVLDNPNAVGDLLKSLRVAGAQEQAVVLAGRAAAQAALDDPQAVGDLLEAMREMEAQEQVAILAARAATHTTLDLLPALAWLLEELRRVGEREQVVVLAERVAGHAAVGPPSVVSRLLEALWEVGAQEQVVVLADRAAAHAALDDPQAVVGLLDELCRVGAGQQAAVLAERAITATALDNPRLASRLLQVLRAVGKEEQVLMVAERAAAHAALDDLQAVVGLLRELSRVGAREQAAFLTERAITGTALDSPYLASHLLDALRSVGMLEQVLVLAERGAAHAAPDDAYFAAWLLEALGTLIAAAQVTALAERVVTSIAPDDPDAVVRLLQVLRQVGARGQAMALAERAASQTALTSPYAIARLLEVLRQIGMPEQLAVLAERASSQAVLETPDAAARLLEVLLKVATPEQVAVLAARTAMLSTLDDPDAVAWLVQALFEAGAQEPLMLVAQRAGESTPLDNPYAVIRLLDLLRKVGAQEQVAVLAERIATHTALDDPRDATLLSEAMRRVEAHNQATALTERLPAAGLFAMYIQIGDFGERFKFGREPDGSPAAPWTWEDLDD
ncbi:hypothetical protein OG713_45420 (plasmid) [Streptomyces sp. NBC_00723]|uniref:hypothetical protein n=1 Tax=Streptomyces sp. NBC_00723 TaxID=2903673 RepID=UPI002F915BC1